MKNPKIYYILFIIAIILSNVKAKENFEKCPFKDTVDLTDLKPFDNGSYVYDNVLIPPSKVAKYNFTLEFDNCQQEADIHLRGCVCSNVRYCVKLCCEYGKYFNEVTFDCEMIPEDLNMPVNMNITMANGSMKTVNIFDYFIPQYGKPCKYLESLTFETDNWILLENGTIYFPNTEEVADTVNYCLSPYRYDGANNNVLVAFSCAQEYQESPSLMINNYAMIISVIFLMATLLVYLFVRDLRENIRGKILIFYLLCLIFAYSILSFINASGYIFSANTCKVLGFSAYYFLMASLLWLSVLHFDIWTNLNDLSRRNQMSLLRYFIYAWGITTLFTALSQWAQNSEKIPQLYKPGIGDDFCFIDTSKWSAGIYYYGPISIIMIFNIFTLIIFCFRNRKSKEISYNVIPPAFFIVGLLWIFDIASFLLQNINYLEYVFIVTDFCISLQGVWIFLVLVLRRHMWRSMNKSCLISKS
ncbi:G-protein coupled receptor Mth2-like [Haematobia irritans]|uniref:G-protein coupled receptor Mth2-like n=1 Tax=Haematobia irritans TaxID=7368 RepID=UPI003F504840